MNLVNGPMRHVSTSDAGLVGDDENDKVGGTEASQRVQRTVLKNKLIPRSHIVRAILIDHAVTVEKDGTFGRHFAFPIKKWRLGAEKNFLCAESLFWLVSETTARLYTVGSSPASAAGGGVALACPRLRFRLVPPLRERGLGGVK